MPAFTVNLGAAHTGITDLRATYLNSANATISTDSATTWTHLGSGVYGASLTPPSLTVRVRVFSFSQPTLSVTITYAAADGVPAGGVLDAVSAYLYTRDAEGLILPATSVRVQLVAWEGADGNAPSDAEVTYASDAAGLFTVSLLVGGTYRYSVGSGRYRTVTITDATSDPLPLPEVIG